MEEHKRVVQETYLLTENEKTVILALIDQGHPQTIQAMESYQVSRDTSRFYEDMRAVIRDKEGSGAQEGETAVTGGDTSYSYSSTYNYTQPAPTTDYSNYGTTSYSYTGATGGNTETEPKETYSYGGTDYNYDYSQYAVGGSSGADKVDTTEERQDENVKVTTTTYNYETTGGDYNYTSSYNPVSDIYGSTTVQDAAPSYSNYTSNVEASGIHVAQLDESFETLADKVPLKSLEPNSFFLSCLLGSPQGCDRACFINMVKAFLPSIASMEGEIGRLFDAMDHNKDGRLDPTELASGIEKAVNNTWNPPVKKIWQSLTTQDPEEPSVIAQKAKEYAGESLIQTFLKDINIENERRISFWQLVRSQTKSSVYEMYAAVSGTSTKVVTQTGSTTVNVNVEGGANQPQQEGKKGISKAKLLIKIKRVFNLETIDPIELAQMFLNVDFSDVTVDIFVEVMERLNQGVVSHSVFKKTCKELFEFMDLDGSGTLDKEEFLVSLLTLASGSEAEKIKAAFTLFDLDGNGILSLPEITSYIYSLFIMGRRTDPSIKNMTNKELMQIAASTAQKAFKDIDKNGDGIINEEEFACWVLDKDPATSHAAIMQAAQESQKKHGRRGTLASKPFEHEFTKPKDDINTHVEETKAHSFLVEEVRKDIPLDKIHIKDAMEYLVKNLSNLSAVTKIQFKEAIQGLLKAHHIDVKFGDSFDRILKLFFTIFDENSDGSLNIQELAAGLHILCGGSKKEKIAQTIRFYDKDKNDKLDYDECTDYFYFTFRMLFTNNPDEHIKSLNPLKVAKATAARAFKEMGLGNDAIITFSDFVKWAERSL